ncbi:MAG: sodium-translocating pyrophosphatase [Candidatus Heimdallarchaeum endolithica]|uniref:K(+)-insensitive pyrophosphate-energized proton pump n=1 Tax=Candidatus Heimdallarchaeum endolithica TaxID=2876572 RepID=A0A9Y1BRN9_9ARCH|nr:MAG: sodium-translocating pyrophosphatase [Candidatus Heimdallarchaeum endolithica]
MDLAYISIIVGSVAILIVFLLIYLVMKEDEGTDRMKEIAGFIREGAKAFLKREFTTIGVFIVILAIVLWLLLQWRVALSFVIGSISSLVAAYIGMSIAVRANVRTANKARTNSHKAVVVAFRGGAVTGISIVGLSLLGIGVLFIVFGNDPTVLVGYGFGASLSALFAQIGGGIYTKAADVGADLVGKVENKIPEDDPRNPAAIADQVGDNVGDCAGRGADLFESFSDNIIATMILGLVFIPVYGYNALIFPLLIEAVGIIGSVIGVFFVRATKGKTSTNVYMSFMVAGLISLAGFFAISFWLMKDIRLFYTLGLGLVLTLVVSMLVNYYTITGGRVTKEIAKSSQSGSALNIIIGLAYGLESPVIPLIVVAGVSVASFFIMGGGMLGVFGVAASTMGVLASTGIIMSSDTFGPIADNAEGIATMSGINEEVGSALEELDGVGNVTKAITKGYAMSTCILTSIVILFAFLTQAAELKGIDASNLSNLVVNIANPIGIAAIFIGATMPFLFSALIIKAVGRASFKMADEVRRQFKEDPGILKGETKADYSRCVGISTTNALKEMIVPTLIGIFTPIIMGFLVGVWYLAAYLVAVKVVSGILAMFMFNAGGAWDNAKKYIELGNFGGKGTDTHDAAIIGDTVGDPLKDTAGPSLHILIKLQNILSITLLPLFIKFAFF